MYRAAALLVLHNNLVVTLVYRICVTCRWALLYTLPDSAKGDVKRSALNTALAAAYDFFYK